MMERTYWIKQSVSEPSFPELIWSRPETRHARGKLLIIGGNVHGFSAPGEAYTTAESAGAGTIRVLLPLALQKIFRSFSGPILETEFAANNPSGSFSQSALGEWLAQAEWADAVLIAGDLGRNSETAIIIEKFLQKHIGSVILAKDAVDYFVPLAKTLINRKDTTLVLSMAQLQKLGMAVGFDKPFILGMDMIQLAETLHAFTARYSIEIVVKHLGNVFVGADSKISSTKQSGESQIWRVSTAAAAAVWRMQSPSKPFEALTTSLIIT